MNAYEELAKAIVIQATADYKNALLYTMSDRFEKRIKTIEMSNDSEEKKDYKIKREIDYKHRQERNLNDCERFFKGKRIKSLTDISGEKIMEKVREEVEKALTAHS